MTKFLVTPTGQQLAYSFIRGTGPTVIFLGGFKSDMEGSASGEDPSKEQSYPSYEGVLQCSGIAPAIQDSYLGIS